MAQDNRGQGQRARIIRIDAAARTERRRWLRAVLAEADREIRYALESGDIEDLDAAIWSAHRLLNAAVIDLGRFGLPA